MATADDATQGYKYDVCLSFAGEDRKYVEEVAAQLTTSGTRVFYDEYARTELWGKDLYAHLDDVYRKSARYCVVFISETYASKLWTTHELKSAQARALSENTEYILPARFDDTEMPGLLPTIGHIDLRGMEPSALASFITDKLGPRQRENFLPPNLDRLYASLEATDDETRAMIADDTSAFHDSMRRMSQDERLLLGTALMHGCPADLPDNTHVAIDLIRRSTGFPPAKSNASLAA